MAFLSVIILTLNEEIHISRAIKSVASIADEIIVVDSGSIDRTVDLSRCLGAKVYENQFINHSTQFNWALNKVSDRSDWIFRLDADEYLAKDSANLLRCIIDDAHVETSGYTVDRSISFFGSLVRFGGVSSLPVVRLFRRGKGFIEERWMDEHILVDGRVRRADGVSIIDDNKNSLDWWLSKHMKYASLEAFEVLRREAKEFKLEESSFSLEKFAKFRRFMKVSVYHKISPEFRTFVYFFYRYLLRLGFLDSRMGRSFHVLQGFWYRYLVELKIFQAREAARADGGDYLESLRRSLNLASS